MTAFCACSAAFSLVLPKRRYDAPDCSNYSISEKSDLSKREIECIRSPTPLLSLYTSYNGKIRRCLCSVSRERRDSGQETVKALQSKNRYPKKWLGQHYMVDENINEVLVDVAEVQSGDVVLEIGPGTGSLTAVLLKAGAQVIGVEKDPDMASLVVERFHNGEQIEVVCKDFLKWHVRDHVSQSLKLANERFRHERPAKVVSNIPFNITTDITRQLLPMGDLFSTMVLLIQDDAATRLTSSLPKSDDYRPINLFVDFYSVSEYKLKVPRTCFFPQPQVDAAVVSFKLKVPSEYPKVPSQKAFFSLVNSAFNSKRKMLRNSLQHICKSSEIESALTQIDLPATSRPAELSLDQFVQLHHKLNLHQTSNML